MVIRDLRDDHVRLIYVNLIAGTERQLLEWETGNFIYSCMFLDGKNLSREAVQAIVSGELVRKASFADYATAQGLEAAADYLRKLAADIETPCRPSIDAIMPNAPALSATRKRM